VQCSSFIHFCLNILCFQYPLGHAQKQHCVSYKKERGAKIKALINIGNTNSMKGEILQPVRYCTCLRIHSELVFIHFPYRKDRAICFLRRKILMSIQKQHEIHLEK